MNIRKTTLVSVLACMALALTAVPACASATRELITSFGPFVRPSGLAVDLETGNVYVVDSKANTIRVFGPNGETPTDGVPSQISGTTIDSNANLSHGIAVDNSCYEHEPRLTGKACEEFDPAYGDVYVEDSQTGGECLQKFKLNSKGQYEQVGSLSTYKGGVANPQTPVGVTVDALGDVYAVDYFEHIVLDYKKTVEKVITGGQEELVENIDRIEIPVPESLEKTPADVAVDGAGGLYVSDGFEFGGPSEGDFGVEKLTADETGNVLSQEIFVPNTGVSWRPLAVNRVTETVLVGAESSIAEYDLTGALQLTFGSAEALGGSLGENGRGANAIAVNSTIDRVYVANQLHEDVDVFGPVAGPPVIEAQQPAASSITRTSALIAGRADPESANASYHFEYVDEAEYELGAANPYRAGRQTAIEPLSGGHTVQSVERLPLTGLSPSTVYHYRMVVSNATATTYGPDETFTTAAATPPVASTGPILELTATSVVLTGSVAPRGLSTSYVFEVGTDTSYGGAKLFGNAGNGTGEVPATVTLDYLVPGATYHYRLVATSFDGTSFGQDETFTTPGVPAVIGQPPSEPLIASPTVQFPSVAGAVTKPVGASKAKKPKRRAGKRKKQSPHKGKGGRGHSRRRK